MAGLPPLPAAAPAAAEDAAHPLAALEVTHIPAGTTHAELAGLFAQFCSLERVVTVFEHFSGGGGSGGGGGGDEGSALVLLPPAEGAADAAELAADILDCYPLEGSMLGVRLCDSPAAWLQRALGAQVRCRCTGRDARVSFLWGEIARVSFLWGEIARVSFLWGELARVSFLWGELARVSFLWGELARVPFLCEPSPDCPLRFCTDAAAG